MAISFNPITLPASKMLASMTTLIGEIRFSDTLSPSDIVNEMVDSCRIGKVDYGKGIVYNFKLDTQPVKELTETSSAFTITKPNVGQEFIPIDEYKFVPISVSEILTKDAVLKGQSVNDFFAFVMSLMEDTTQFHLYDEINNLYQTWTPGQASQIIYVDQIDTTGMTGAELNQSLIWNSNEMAKVMRKTLNNMKVKNTKFTDQATYTDENEETHNVVSAIRGDNLKLVVNDKYWTDFMAQSLSSLYHSEKIGEMIPGEKFVLIPEDKMSQDNSDVIGWLHTKEKFALADFYRVALSILDPSTTYQNSFYHFSYGLGVFKYAPGVVFKTRLIQG